MDAGDVAVGPIVVGVDGSDTSHAALRWAAEEASLRRTPLRVVHAWPPPNVGWPWPLSGVYVDPAPYEAAAQYLVDEAADLAREELGDRAPLIETRTPEGVPVHALVTTSADADLLVLGSRGRGGFASLLLGSVAAGCAQHSTVPVAVIGAEGAVPGSGPVVVGIDGSQTARAAVRWAAREAARLHQPLVVLHGWDAPDVAPPGDLAFGPRPEEFAAQGTDLLEAAVADALAGIASPPEVETRLVRDSPAKALIEASKSAGLLVVGTRGRGGFGGLVLGSVSQQCLHHAASPVVVVPALADPTPPGLLH